MTLQLIEDDNITNDHYIIKDNDMIIGYILQSMSGYHVMSKGFRNFSTRWTFHSLEDIRNYILSYNPELDHDSNGEPNGT